MPTHTLAYTFVQGPSIHDLVVFVPGIGNHRSSWEYQQQYFAMRTKHSVILVDLRGMGNSHSPPGTWTVPDMAGDLILLLDTLPSLNEVETVHLVGHSLGGLICVEVARRAPPSLKIATLSLLAVTLGDACCRSRPWMALNWSGIASLIGLALAAPEDKLSAALQLNYPEEWRRATPAFDGEGGTNEAAVVRHLVRTVRGRRPVSATAWIKHMLSMLLYRTPKPPLLGPAGSTSSKPSRVRALVLGGDDDELLSVRAMRATADALGCAFVVLEGVGHNLHVQAARRVNAALVAHIDGGTAEQPVAPVRDGPNVLEPML
jgi:pimeloyl-ACP methyl ester carboxylesterase